MLASSALFFITLQLVSAQSDVVTSPRLDAETHARVTSAVGDALARDPRLDVVTWKEEALDTRCTRDPACLSRAADAHSARFVIFGQAGRGGPLLYLILDGFDVRLGSFAGRESVHTGTEADLAGSLDRMVDAVVGRMALSSDSGEPTRVLFLGLVEAPLADDDESVFGRIPWIAYGAGGLVAIGLLAQGIALSLLVAAAVRDQDAANAELQFDAYVIQQQRNLLASLALMTGAMGLSFFTFAAMTGTYGLLEEL
jgi:hypothetical protein